jgi:hypothetical protein
LIAGSAWLVSYWQPTEFPLQVWFAQQGSLLSPQGGWHLPEAHSRPTWQGVPAQQMSPLAPQFVQVPPLHTRLPAQVLLLQSLSLQSILPSQSSSAALVQVSAGQLTHMPLPLQVWPLGQSPPQHCRQVPPQSLGALDGQLYEQSPLLQLATLPPLAPVQSLAEQHCCRQVPLQSRGALDGQLYEQTPPLQLATLPPLAPVQSVAEQHCCWQVVPHFLPPGQSNSHWPLRQAATPPPGAPQGLQLAPQLCTLLLSLHSPLQS